MAAKKKTKGTDKPARGPGGRFLPGECGNKAGRPRKAVQALRDLQMLLLDAAPTVVARLVIQAAGEGDTTAARILLDNLPHTDSRISLDPGDKMQLDSAADVLDYSKKIIELTANGGLSLSQGEALGRLLDKHSRMIESERLEKRIEALEGVG
jgi:hypothetical protein